MIRFVYKLELVDDGVQTDEYFDQFWNANEFGNRWMMQHLAEGYEPERSFTDYRGAVHKDGKMKSFNIEIIELK